MPASDYDLVLQELVERSVDRLLMAEVFDLEAFESLRAYLTSKASAIANEHVVSKQVLASLMRASSSIRSAIPYVHGAQEHQYMAEKFDSLLGLIVSGIDPASRQPGVPRII